MDIYQKLLEVRKSVDHLLKKEKGAQYNYVSSSQTIKAVREEMNKQGLLLIPRIKSHELHGDTVIREDDHGVKHTTTWLTELDVEYEWIDTDSPEKTIIVPWYGQGVDIAGEKGVGKALTYSEKYFFWKFFNIPTDKDDPDANQVNTPPATTALRKAPTPENPAQGGICPIHGVPFQKHTKGDQSWWSHQTEDGEWCNKSTALKSRGALEAAQMDGETQELPQEGTEQSLEGQSERFKQEQGFLDACWDKLTLTEANVCEQMSVNKVSEIADLRGAWAFLKKNNSEEETDNGSI